MRLKLFIVAIGCALVLCTLSAKGQQLTIPGSTKGVFTESQSMPETLDRGAKGGAAEKFSFTVKSATKFRALLECDSCLPRLVLQGDGTFLKKASDPNAAFLSTNLEPGAYTLWAGTVQGRQGPFILSTSSGEEIAGKIPVYDFIKASYQSGTRTVKKTVMIRVGLESVVLLDSMNAQIFKSYKRSDIQSIDSQTTNKTNVGAAIMWGPSVAGAQQQKWIRLRTSDENIALEVPSNTYQLLLGELEGIVKK